jgi:hypothetical protein
MKMITQDRIKGQQLIGKSCKAITGDSTRLTRRFISPGEKTSNSEYLAGLNPEQL